jgi:hypothetical protein
MVGYQLLEIKLGRNSFLAKLAAEFAKFCDIRSLKCDAGCLTALSPNEYLFFERGT